MNQGALGYGQREAAKSVSYRARHAGAIDDIQHFEDISLMWWHRCRYKVKLEAYRRHLIRARLLAGELVNPEIVSRYPPTNGLVRILPKMSEWLGRGMPEREIKTALGQAGLT
jgi:hypothetical protein